MEWVSAKDVMAVLGARFAIPGSAEVVRVCRWAHNGLVRTRARRLVRWHRQGQESADDVELPSRFWWPEGHEALEQDWEAGDFVSWVGNDPTRPEPSRVRDNQLQAFGVTFNAEDLAACGVVIGEPVITAPARDLSTEPFMGLLEAVAWIAFRDPDVANRARWMSLDGPTPDGAAALHALPEDPASPPDYREVFNRCATGDSLVAFGRQGGPPTEIPASQWIDARIVFENDPDSILPAGPNNGLFTPRWTHVCFRRSDVMRIWPAGPPPIEGEVNPQAAHRSDLAPKPRRKARSGPKLDMEWRKAVRDYCRVVGVTAVADQRIGPADFLAFVTEHHKQRGTVIRKFPKDPRRTAQWRSQWLDEQAGLAPRT